MSTSLRCLGSTNSLSNLRCIRKSFKDACFGQPELVLILWTLSIICVTSENLLTRCNLEMLTRLSLEYGSLPFSFYPTACTSNPCLPLPAMKNDHLWGYLHCCQIRSQIKGSMTTTPWWELPASRQNKALHVVACNPCWPGVSERLHQEHDAPGARRGREVMPVDALFVELWSLMH